MEISVQNSKEDQEVPNQCAEFQRRKIPYGT